MQRRDSTLRGRRLSAYEQLVERAVASRVGAWAFVHLLSPVDGRLVPLTRGRVSLALGAPVGVLETTGARTGRLRRTPLLYLLDDERIVLVASNGGSDRDPAWLHNLQARPFVRFLSRECGWRDYRAHVAAGAERTRCWALVTDLFAGYERYQERSARRQIPLVVLAHRGIVMPPAT